MHTNSFVSLLLISGFVNMIYCDQCSDVSDISKCLSTSNFCYVVEANVPYVSKANSVTGVVLDAVNDKCMSLNFYTQCNQLVTKESCKLGSCLWDPLFYECFEWDTAPCQSYPVSICQWNPQCELFSETLTLDLATNYTLMNSVDSNQYDGRRVGTWLYEFGQITAVLDKQTTKETYSFTKCQMKNTCKLIQIPDITLAVYTCQNTDMDCYYSKDTGQCETISHLTQCSEITWYTKCESGAAPCIWLSTRCAPYDDPEVSCYILGQDRCLNNQKCFLEGITCKPYLGCGDFKTKPQCDQTSIYNCYFDDYENVCKILTTNIQCKKIGQKNCPLFTGKCQWNSVDLICGEMLQDFFCEQLVETACPEPINKTPMQCKWDVNVQLCVWVYSYDCSLRKFDTCDTNDSSSNRNCYYDKVMNLCTQIQPNSKCEFFGQYACSSNTVQTLCQWSSSRNLCISIFDVQCQDLSLTFCKYREKCFQDGNKCNSRKQCSDYTQISDCQDDTELHCYYDYDLLECSRVTTQSSCNQIFREVSCNQAICAWKNGICQNLEDVSCTDLTIQNCKYSNLCYYYNSECIPLDACGLNDGDQPACVVDAHHCLYNTEMNKCIQIDGSSTCASIIGADNCNYSACVLQPGTNKKLQCLEYEQADCSYLKQDYCNFGQCTWNVTQKACVTYPAVQSTTVIDNPDTTNTTAPNTTRVDNTTIPSCYCRLLLIGLYLAANLI